MVEDIICFRNKALIQPKQGAIFRYYHNTKQLPQPSFGKPNTQTPHSFKRVLSQLILKGTYSESKKVNEVGW